MTEKHCQACIDKWGQMPSPWGDSVSELESYEEHRREHVEVPIITIEQRRQMRERAEGSRPTNQAAQDVLSLLEALATAESFKEQYHEEWRLANKEYHLLQMDFLRTNDLLDEMKDKLEAAAAGLEVLELIREKLVKEVR